MMAYEAKFGKKRKKSAADAWASRTVPGTRFEPKMEKTASARLRRGWATALRKTLA